MLNVLKKSTILLKMIKKLLKKTINKLGFDLKSYDSRNKQINFDYLLKDKISKNPIIFDVGGNKGQSIEKYLKIFEKPIIHSFESVKTEFDYMYKKFKNNENIFLNNFALGDKTEEKESNVTAKTSTSSFNKINLGTDWLKVRSQQNNTSKEGYVTLVQKVNVIKLDDYCKDNNISVIDLVKIDTQGYEDKVLEGSLNSIKKNEYVSNNGVAHYSRQYGSQFLLKIAFISIELDVVELRSTKPCVCILLVRV